MTTWKMTHYPLGVSRISDCGRYEIWSAKPGTGHLLRCPDDPMRFLVKLRVEAPGDPEGGYTRTLYRTWKLGVAKKFVEQHIKGVVRGEGE